MKREPIVVVGIGQDGASGLGPAARAHLAAARVLAGGRRHLAFFPEFAGERVVLDSDLPGWIEKIKHRDPALKTVILASGDPLFYGIGRSLLDALGPAELEFVPHVGSVALAFARLKETWHDACIVSVHGRPLSNLLAPLEQRARKIAVFTDALNGPAAIARLLRAQGLAGAYEMWVCENLDGTEERVRRFEPADLHDVEFAALNIVVLLAHPEITPVDLGPLLGLPESAFAHRGEGDGGMITKRAVRVQALAELQLRPGDVLWDIGAGSGSVGIEAARLSSSLQVYAIDHAPEQLRENLARFGLPNIQLVDGVAPEALAGLPAPDAVFLGGSGGRLIPILEQATDRLRSGGRLVVACIALETFAAAWTWLAERGLNPEATALHVARSRPLGPLHCLEPERPIHLVRMTKP